MAITNGTNITALEKPAVGVDTGPGWATALNNSIDAVDAHDHTTNKGSRITTAAININADLEFNEYQAKELKGLILSQSNASSDNSAIYSTSGNLYWRNSSGSAVQITDGSSVKGAAGTITGMGSDAGNQAGASYTHGSRAFNFFTDAGNSDFAKINFSDVNLYKFSDDDSADSAYITIVADSGISGAAGTITVPGETGTMLTSNSTVTDINITSTTDLKPILTLKNTNSGTTGPTFKFVNDKGAAGAANDICGIISFYGDDAAQTNMEFAKVEGIVAVHTDGQEGGQLKFSVASHDGEMQPGLIITDGSAEDEIDVTIGNGTASVTTISGTLDLGDRAILNVGDIDCDSISVADAANGLDVNFNGNTGTNKISLTDNLASALDITEASNSYIKFVTTNSSEQIVFGKNSTFASTTIADLGTVTTADINGGTLGGFTIDGSWTAASQTCANLGTVTTADINGGTIDGVTIGGASAAAGSFTSLDVDNGNITNVGDIDCDSISIADASVGLDINFGGNTTLNKITLTDNLADALNINEGGTSYIKFVTSNSSEAIVTGKDLETLTTTKIKQKGAFMQSSTHQALTLGY
jgi:hypothetical protein